VHLSLRYVTTFIYTSPVWESHNALRARPRPGPRQRLSSYRVSSEPAASVFSYDDRWGTQVDTFGIRERHSELTVVAEAEVETAPPPPPSGAPISELSSDRYREESWLFLQPTRHTRWGAGVEEAARSAVDGAGDVVEAIVAVDRTVHERLDYRPGATEVGVDVESVWSAGAGVCQDFAHLTIAMLRAAGIGARYVSGYFYASDPTQIDTAEQGEIVVATHAWVEAAIPERGWWAIDPTNAAPVGERHVEIGHGRDYDDVTPLRGVYFGDAKHLLAAEVAMSTGSITRRSFPAVDPDLQAAAQQ
jgi:transglutaminase-like putative cysteine protease